MKYNKNKNSYKEINATVKSLGIVGNDGIYHTKSGVRIDLTASASDRLSVLENVVKELLK